MRILVLLVLSGLLMSPFLTPLPVAAAPHLLGTACLYGWGVCGAGIVAKVIRHRAAHPPDSVTLDEILRAMRGDHHRDDYKVGHSFSRDVHDYVCGSSCRRPRPRPGDATRIKITKVSDEEAQVSVARAPGRDGLDEADEEGVPSWTTEILAFDDIAVYLKQPDCLQQPVQSGRRSLLVLQSTPSASKSQSFLRTLERPSNFPPACEQYADQGRALVTLPDAFEKQVWTSLCHDYTRVDPGFKLNHEWIQAPRTFTPLHDLGNYSDVGFSWMNRYLRGCGGDTYSFSAHGGDGGLGGLAASEPAFWSLLPPPNERAPNDANKFLLPAFWSKLEQLQSRLNDRSSDNWTCEVSGKARNMIRGMRLLSKLGKPWTVSAADLRATQNETEVEHLPVQQLYRRVEVEHDPAHVTSPLVKEKYWPKSSTSARGDTTTPFLYRLGDVDNRESVSFLPEFLSTSRKFLSKSTKIVFDAPDPEDYVSVPQSPRPEPNDSVIRIAYTLRCDSPLGVDVQFLSTWARGNFPADWGRVGAPTQNLMKVMVRKEEEVLFPPGMMERVVSRRVVAELEMIRGVARYVVEVEAELSCPGGAEWLGALSVE